MKRLLFFIIFRLYFEKVNFLILSKLLVSKKFYQSVINHKIEKIIHFLFFIFRWTNDNFKKYSKTNIGLFFLYLIYLFKKLLLIVLLIIINNIITIFISY